MDSTQALNTISSVSGAYNTRKYQRYRRKEREKNERDCLQSSNSSGHAPRDTWPQRESPTSSSVEKVILGVNTNRKGVRERGEESPSVQDWKINQMEGRIPIEAEYIL